MSTPLCTLETSKSTAILTFTSPPQNAFNGPFVADIISAFDEVEKNPTLKSLVITGGADKYFSTGYDLEWWMKNVHSGDMLEKFFESMNYLLNRILLFPKGVVAAINGHIFGQAVFVAGCADFRIMRDDRGWVNLPEVHINIPLVPSQYSIMKEILPPASYRDMILLGKKYTASDAMKLGYIDEVTSAASLMDRALEKAGEYEKVNIEAFAEIKRRIRKDLARIIADDDKPFIETALKASRKKE